WAQDTKLAKKDLLALVDVLKTTYKVDKVSLLGYSMGGRVCLTIVQSIPATIDKAVLIAADGLEINLYYYFFTRTFIGSKIFKYMLEKPETFLKITDWLKNKKLVDASRHKFVMGYLKPEAGRKFLQK